MRGILALGGGLVLVAGSALALSTCARAQDEPATDAPSYASADDSSYASAGDSSNGSDESPADDSGSEAAAESARVRYLDGDARIERADDDTVADAAVNSPIFAGDAVVTGSRGRAEVQLANGTLIRLDEGAKATFLSLPESGAVDQDTVLQLSAGSAQIETRGALSRRADFRIDTSTASVYVLAAGSYRIDAEEGKRVRVSAFRGVAEVVGDDGSVMLRSGQRTLADSSGEPERPRAFNTSAADDFDEWVGDRGERYRRAAASSEDEEGADEEEIPDAVRPYRSELSYYGDWVTIAPYGRCWVPSGVGVSWRPYYNGSWEWGPGGYFWVSYDPWGWAPYHYGRWSWIGGHGWCWVPGGVFAGAWVSWYYGPSYIGWCPLDFWNYPCALRFGFRGIDYHCWNFINYRNIYVRNVTKVYVNPTVVRAEAPRGVVVRRPVPLRPRDIVRNHFSPPLLLQRARDQKGGQIDLTRDPAARRPFRDREKEILSQAPHARKAGSEGRGGSAGLERGPGNAPGKGPGGTQGRGPAGERPRRPGMERRPEGPTPRGGSAERPDGGARKRNEDRLPVRPRQSRPGRADTTLRPEIGGRDRARPAPDETSIPGRAVPPDLPRYRPRPSPDEESPRERARPRRRHDERQGPPPEARDGSDRRLREFFRDSEPRREPQPREPMREDRGTHGGRPEGPAPPRERPSGPPPQARPPAPQHAPHASPPPPPSRGGGENRHGDDKRKN